MPGDELHLSGEGQVELLRAFVDRGASLRTTVHGSSMFPFVRDGDVVTIAPVGDRGVRAGDVVAALHPVRRELVIHRTIAWSGDGWLVRGDACAAADGVVPVSEVLGRVVAVERRGKTVRLGIGRAGPWLAALSRGGFLGTGPGLATIPARGVRRLLRAVERGPAPAPAFVPGGAAGTSGADAQALARRRLLLALRAGDVDRAPIARLAIPDWEAVLSLADRHGVTPLVHRSLQRSGLADAVPAGVRERLRETALAVGARNARSLAHAGRLLRELERAGIQAAALKGADLAERAYEDVSLRPMADVDLLVRPRDVKRASELLARQGFAPTAPATGEAPQGAIDENLHVEPLRKAGGPLVELHYAIGVPARVGGIDMEGVWSRMERGTVGGVPALVLAPEDLLLHLCIHVALHHGFDAKLVQLVDLRAVVERLGGRIDWAALDRRAGEWGVRRAVALTFALAERLLGPVAPPGAAPALPEAERVSDPLGRAEELLFQPGRRGMGSANLPVLLGAGPWTAKARLAVRRAFPSREEMAFTYRVSPSSPRLLGLYPWRVVELLRRHGGTIRAVAGGDADASRVLAAEQERAALVDWMRGETSPPPPGGVVHPPGRGTALP